MLTVDLSGSAAIVTGGTRGLGQAIGLELARAGATVVLTHRWGSADEAELARAFEREGLPAPIVLEADASDPEATRHLMAAVRGTGLRLRAIVSNVAFAKVVGEMGDLKRSTLELSLRYSAWPVVDLVQAAHEVLGYHPAYVVGVSSDGPDVCHPGYDLAGAAKAVLETLCRYLALRLRPEGVRVNAVRPGFLDTESARATLGIGAIEHARRTAPGLLQDARGVARACVALCSGMMDAVTGQVLTVDEGWSLVSPVAWITGQVPPGFPEPEGGR